MNEFKGTKGKWEVIGSHSFETKVTCGNIRIADAKHYNHGDDDWTVNDPTELEGKANAKLISKAPEMLEMLERIAHGENTPTVFEIRELIKEATNIMKDQHINFLLARVEALEKELENKTNQLKEACELLKETHELLEKLAKEMEVEYEQIN